MIILLVILGSLAYLWGGALAFLYTASTTLQDGSGIPPQEWGPFSKWLYTVTKRGDLLGNAVIILHTLLWPITLPLLWFRL